MSGVQTITVAADDGELRLDRWFRRHFPGLAHGRLEKLLRTGQVRVDGHRAKSGDRIAPGQLIRVPPLGELAPLPRSSAPPEPRPRDIAMLERAVLHIDDDVIVIDKPPGLAVQGGTDTEHHLDAMLDALRFGAKERPRLVHRLDRDTSGVLVLARSAPRRRRARCRLSGQGDAQDLLGGGGGAAQAARAAASTRSSPSCPDPAASASRPTKRKASAPSPIIAPSSHAGDKLAWLVLQPITGRTHQLRAHCVTLGTPILGDGKYGGAAAHPAGVPHARELHLHARALSLPHPAGGRLEVVAPLPPHMRETWAFFGFDEGEEPDPFADIAPER